MVSLRPRMFHKGLILLFVPLLFETVVAASLLYLHHYYDEAVKAEDLRRQIVFHINEFWFYSTEVTTTKLGTVFVKDFRPPLRSDRRARGQYAVLKALLADDPQQLSQLEQIITAYYRCRDIAGELTAESPDSPGRLGQVLALKSNLKTCKHLLAANIEAGRLIRSFREYQLQQSIKSAEHVKSVALVIQLVLAGAIVGSAIMAFLLFRYFMLGIHRGIQALIHNIQCFKQGAALAPAVEGSDEIALLDARFHEMAADVASAQRMRETFVSTLSSECRTPITETREYLLKLCDGLDSALSERGKVRASNTEKALQRLIGLMNDLLALEAPGKTYINVSKRDCSLNEIIQSSIDAVSTQAEKSGITLEVSGEQVEAYADPDRIVQVLVNLLSNAIKFSPAGSTVSVNAHTKADQVEVKVTDRGRGIPAHLRKQIFDRFQQVTSSDATEKGGTGLGLPICQDIVERHGGRIGVESQEGKGSTFWFYLPVRGQTKE